MLQLFGDEFNAGRFIRSVVLLPNRHSGPHQLMSMFFFYKIIYFRLEFGASPLKIMIFYFYFLNYKISFI